MYVATSRTYMTNRFVGQSDDLDALKKQCLDHCLWVSGHPATMAPFVVITVVGDLTSVRTLGGIFNLNAKDVWDSTITWDSSWTILDA